MNLLRNQKGFTILELVIVIVIIGVLVAVGVPKYLNMQQQSQIAADQANKSAIQSAIMNRYVERLNSGQKVYLSDVINEFNSNPNAFFPSGKVPKPPTNVKKRYKAKLQNGGIKVYIA